MVRAMFPGTFDPIHYGHIDIAERATKLFDELVIAVYDKPLKSLLFSPEERIDLVNRAFAGHPKIRVVGYSGLTVNMAHQINAQVIVRGLRVFSDFEFEFRMALANHRLAKDVGHRVHARSVAEVCGLRPRFPCPALGAVATVQRATEGWAAAACPTCSSPTSARTWRR